MGPLTLGLAAVLATTLFGQYAQDISQWLSCGYGRPCARPELKIEALNIGTLASTITAIAAAGIAGSIGKISHRDSVIAIAGALLGALLALFKAAAAAVERAAGAEPVSALELLPEPIFYWTVVFFLFGLPFILLPRADGGLERLVGLYRRLALALICGAVLGGLLQTLALPAWAWWSGEPDRSFLVIAPSGATMAIAPWTVAMLDPWLRLGQWREPRRFKLAWTSLYGGSALFLAGAHGILHLYYDDGAVRCWVDSVDATRSDMVLLAAGLLLPGLMAVAAVLLPRPHSLTMWRSTAALLAAAGLAAFAAVWAAALRQGADSFSADDVFPFVAMHALTAALVVVIVPLTSHLDTLLMSRWTGVHYPT
ncbi:MAG TPA: hypothetical protein VHG92_04160 [Afifellaceae bacterium]|nr:hypothetical protein [Afifellaceae bacterium]